MSKLRIGLIGVGRHGARYANHLKHDPLGAELVAIARRDAVAAAEQAREYGCRAYHDWRELVAAPDVDAVIAVVPPTLHREIVRAAVTERKPLLLEKPAAPNLDHGREMLSLVKQNNLPVMVAQTLRYNGVVRQFMEALPQIGAIHALRLGQRFEPSRPGWIDDPAIAGGGMVLHTGVHCFDLVRFLSGLEVERVSCEVSQVRVKRTEDNFAAVLRLSDHTTLATVAGSRATGSRSGGVEIAGERGQLIGDHVLNWAAIVTGSQVQQLSVPPPVPTVREVVREFVRAIQAGEPVPIPLEEGLRAVAIVEACYEAAARQQSVSVADLTAKHPGGPTMGRE